MAESRVSPTLIGGFVVGATALAVLAVLLLGSGRLFEDRTHMVSYFSSSVRGLDIGAPVIFRGVSVGEVVRIDAVVDSRTLEVAVPVYFDLVQDRVEVVGPRSPGTQGLQAMIAAGLRAQLKSQSLITGKLYIDLDLHPETEVVYSDLKTRAIEMPTVPTTLEEFERQARAVLDRVSQLPLEDLVTRLASAASGLDALVNDPKLAGAIDRLEGTLAGTERLAEELDGRLDELATSTGATLEEIRSAAASLDSMVEPGSPVQYQLITTLEELEVAARSLRLLADNLSRQPEQLIFGKPTKGSRE